MQNLTNLLKEQLASALSNIEEGEEEESEKDQSTEDIADIKAPSPLKNAQKKVSTQ